MHIHILGIGGTFMGGIAVLAHELGAKVTGCDSQLYPPMSDQLREKNIEVTLNYEKDQLEQQADHWVVGNVMRRGLPITEALLEKNLPYESGPEWLSRHILKDKWVIAVSGTHGKTTTSSLIAWILEYAGLNPGFLIGGLPCNFGISARLGSGKFFVVEADEYDSAFFDKRSKFVHYRPRTLVINNLEFDHADIFSNLAAIQTQFHHLVRTVPGNGLIIQNANDVAIQEVLTKGCWTPLQGFGLEYTEGFHVTNLASSGSSFDVCFKNQTLGRVVWNMLGLHNVQNALAAIAAAQHAGVDPKIAIQALKAFKGVKRRMEFRGSHNDVSIFDDFAHHPTAIGVSLHGMRQQFQGSRLLAVLDIRSNTMKLGHHKNDLPEAVKLADQLFMFHDDSLAWDIQEIWQKANKPGGVYKEIDALVAALLAACKADDQIIFMSNGSFQGIYQRILEGLHQKDWATIS